MELNAEAMTDPMKRRMEAEQRQREQEEQRRLTLKGILEQAAFERLKRIELVKPEKARLIEQHLIQNGMRISGGEKIGEDQLVSLLHQIENGQGRGPTVTINRRRVSEESDDELWKD
eukprot:Blabericola_migrator_1__4743@NODE_249_length_10888_cov_100_919231_g210_i0_p8_GENE_NODE_249_length_10888_cov_100_919231_g210_i0NODE_249_length_10888_cov_100_919231_g210_i0_p8_ORF_typecomplete_len117_score29_69dsDNA_bind/PF01984_20/3_8e20T2SSM/PF04612_12/0_019DUF4670/PF15709_5/0_054_NODE_249_length_10888_cov_100_919231_g210_i0218568